MRWLGILALWGCSFHGAAVVSGDATPGSALPVDSTPIDAAPLDSPAALCAVAASGSATAGGVLGGNGGSSAPDLACQTGELPVGFAFDVTTGTPPGWAEVAVTGIHVRCARLVDTAAGMTTATAELVDRVAGQCGDSGGHSWAATAVAELDCPSGSALVGLTANADKSGSTQSMFNTVAIQCAPLASSGQPGAPTTISFATGANTDHQQTAACPANDVIVSFKSRSGCGQDQLAPQCVPVTCN